MGLDIGAYGNLKHVGTLGKEEDFYESELYSDDLIAMESYRFDKRYSSYTDGMELINGGVYSYECAYDFRAGSYSGYNRWRNQLSEMIIKVPARAVWDRPDYYKSSPFFHLICFSDCEGMIGGAAAQKLLKDFAAHQETVTALPDILENEGFARVYADFQKAFEMAANNGLVIFH